MRWWAMNDIKAQPKIQPPSGEGNLCRREWRTGNERGTWTPKADSHKKIYGQAQQMLRQQLHRFAEAGVVRTTKPDAVERTATFEQLRALKRAKP